MKIKEIQLIALFDSDPMFLINLQKVINSWSNFLKANVHTPAVPVNAPPEVPRVQLLTPRLQLSISLNRVSLHYQVEDKENLSITSFWQKYKNIFNDLENLGLNSFKFAIFHKIHYSSSNKKTLLEINKLVHESFFKHKFDKSPTQVGVNFGYEEDFGFINYNFHSYETRQVLPHQAGQILNKNQFPILDSGLEVVVEINNLHSPIGTLEDQFGKLNSQLSLFLKSIPMDFLNLELQKALNLPVQVVN